MKPWELVLQRLAQGVAMFLAVFLFVFLFVRDGWSPLRTAEAEVEVSIGAEDRIFCENYCAEAGAELVGMQNNTKTATWPRPPPLCMCDFLFRDPD